MLRLPHDEFEREWADNGMAAKRAGGLLRSVIVHETPATNPDYTGGTSRIIKLMTANNRHIGTLHEIVTLDGTVPHSHAKDYTRRDCSRIGPELAFE